MEGPVELCTCKQTIFDICNGQKHIFIVWFQKMSIVPPQKGLEIPGDGGISKAKNCKEMYGA